VDHYIERDITQELTLLLKEYPVVTILGPCQSGNALYRPPHRQHRPFGRHNLYSIPNVQRAPPLSGITRHRTPSIFAYQVPSRCAITSPSLPMSDAPGMWGFDNPIFSQTELSTSGSVQSHAIPNASTQRNSHQSITQTFPSISSYQCQSALMPSAYLAPNISLAGCKLTSYLFELLLKISRDRFHNR
jgi:hypothetical protein